MGINPSSSAAYPANAPNRLDSRQSPNTFSSQIEIASILDEYPATGSGALWRESNDENINADVGRVDCIDCVDGLTARLQTAVVFLSGALTH
jgi:hypothetical protein